MNAAAIIFAHHCISDANWDRVDNRKSSSSHTDIDIGTISNERKKRWLYVRYLKQSRLAGVEKRKQRFQESSVNNHPRLLVIIFVRDSKL